MFWRNKQIEKLVYRSFFDDLSPEEEQILTQELKDSNELSINKRIIEDIYDQIYLMKKDSFNPFFVEKVMKNLQSEKEDIFPLNDFIDSLAWSFKRGLAVSTVICIILITINLIQNEEISFQSAFRPNPCVAL